MTTDVSDSGWQVFGAHVKFRHFYLRPSSGRLSTLSAPNLQVRSNAGLLVALGLPHAVPMTVQTDALADLLANTDADGCQQDLMAKIEADIWRFYSTGRFSQYLPEVLAACLTREGILTWRAGANGVAVADESGILLMNEDLRYSALRRLGVNINSLRPTGLDVDYLADEVSALTQIEPTVAAANEILIRRGQIVLLMSRGAFPFAPPRHTVTREEWWRLDSGWRHGLAADLIVITDEAKIPIADAVINSFGES